MALLQTPQQGQETRADAPAADHQAAEKNVPSKQFYHQGAALYQSGDYQAAKENFLKAYRTSDTAMQKGCMYHNIARCHERLGDLVQAAKDLQMAIAWYDDGDSRRELDRLTAKLTPEQKAEAGSSDVVSKQEFLIGSRFYAEQQYKEAIQHFKKAYAKNAKPEILYNIGRAYLELRGSDEPEEALRYLRLYVTIKPGDDGAERLILDLSKQSPTPGHHPKQHRIDPFLEGQALQTHCKGEDAYTAGKYELALECFLRVLAVTESAGAFWNCANAYEKLGDKQNALSCYRSAAERGENQANQRIVALSSGNAALVPESLF